MRTRRHIPEVYGTRPVRRGSGDRRAMYDFRHMALSAFQRRVLLTCRRARAVLILANALDSARRRELDGDIERLPLLTKKPLAALESHYDAVLRSLDDHLGFVAPLDDYVALVDEAAAMPDQLVFMTKRFIEKHLFKNYGTLMARWPLWA